MSPFPDFDHSLQPATNRGPERDWLVFGLAVACLILTGVSICLAIATWRRYTPKVITKEVIKEVVKPRDPESAEAITEALEPTEKCLVNRLEMMSPPVTLSTLERNDDFRLFQISGTPFQLLLTEDSQGHLNQIVLAAEMSRFDLKSHTEGHVDRDMHELHRIVTTIAYAWDSEMLRDVDKIVGMFKLEATGQSSVNAAAWGTYHVDVRRFKKAEPPMVQIKIERVARL